MTPSENLPKPDEALMTSGEVARLFRVATKTVTRWAATGAIDHVWSPSGHRKLYRADHVRALMTPAGSK
jgi:DNA-binding transcriptional MerR regulator